MCSFMEATVFLYLLLLSGDIEENPGPRDLDYDSINATQVLGEDDLADIIEEIVSIKSVYFSLGRSLRLRPDDLRAVSEACGSTGTSTGAGKESDHNYTERALNDVVLLWLRQKYNVERFGPPTWRMLAEAVDKHTGGNDHELAKKIALNHPKDNVLKNDNLREVLDMFWDYRASWKLIGVELGIDSGTLEAIDKNHSRVEDQLVQLIVKWLRGNNPKPTRSKIARVLQSKYLMGGASSIQVTDSRWDNYLKYLRSLYKARTLATSSDDQWPPPVTHKIFRLAMIRTKEPVRRGYDEGDVIRQKTITGRVDNILKCKVPIELKDIFVRIEESDQQKKVLIEGVAGSGKSTLSLHICHEWADEQLFQEYKLVILVRLCDSNIKNATSVTELLPRRNEKMGQDMAEEIAAVDGRSVLFVLDGWDELPQDVPGHSVILSLLRGILLPESSIIVTSRPTSSASLHPLVSSRIEILGFTKDELRRYFTACLQDDAIAAENLLQRMTENSILEGSCYLPLNASILVHLFKCGGNVLPTTQYGIFTELTCNCILRHLMKTHCQENVEELKSLDELPPEVGGPFQQLCEVAYNGIVEDKVIFDLPSDFNTLGLLQEVESFTIGGKSHMYNFLHLSVQELLAAIYMATKLDAQEQTEKFKRLLGHPRFSAVFQFFAAKTKLRNYGIKEVVFQVAEKCAVRHPKLEDKALLLSLIHCLFEAQDPLLCDLVADVLKSRLNFCEVHLTQIDCSALGYFLTYCKDFEVDLSVCSIGVAQCKNLFRQDKFYNLQILSLYDNSISNEGAMVVSEAMKTMTNLQKLYLPYNSIGDSGAVFIADGVKSTPRLHLLDLSYNSIGAEGAVAISEAIKTLKDLQELYLYGNHISEVGREALATAANMTGVYIW